MLFPPDEDIPYDVDTLAHFFMSRNGINPDVVMNWTTERRNKLYLLEKQVMDKENEDNE